MNPYLILSRLFPTRAAPSNPRRIVVILPCCIGDVILGTAALCALRRAYPAAQITWAVGRWSRAALEGHDLLDDLLDTGAGASPVYSLPTFVRQLRAGRFDLAVSLTRSPLMSAAVWLSGIPYRAGLDSAGRGFGYNIRAPINPQTIRHEAEIYLDVPRALGIDTAGCWANVPVREQWQSAAPYMVINPAGGRNPGMTLDVKRYPPELVAALANRLSAALNTRVIVVAGKDDQPLVDAVSAALDHPPEAFVGALTFAQIAALARGALVYIGNDTGLTHLAAAAGAKTVMILGPTDPRRYAPFAPNALAVWKPAAVAQAGVAAGVPVDWQWARDGISVEEAERAITAFLEIP
jgi:ADP-heptose:LPS heptosyltransferase